MAKSKQLSYKAKSKVFKGLGLASIGVGSTGGFLFYESQVNWANLKTEFEQFVVVSPESVQLNMAIAFPVLIGTVIWLFIALKKNKEFFADKVSMGILLSIAIFYLVYSVIEVTLFSLIGALAGSLLDEFGFSLISKKYARLAEEEREIDLEYDKEVRRISARQAAIEDTNGSV